jgi:hypothetical protein
LDTGVSSDPESDFLVIDSAFRTNGLLVSGKGNVGDRGMVQVAYTLSSYKSTTDAENAVYQQDDLNPDEAYGYGQYDQRHRAVIGGYYTLCRCRSRSARS